MKNKKSNFLSLNWRDVLQGLIMATLTPIIFIIQQSLDAGNLTFDWKKIGITALAGGVAYLVKKFFSPLARKRKVKGEQLT